MHCQTCGAAFRGRGQHCAECKKTLAGLTVPKQTPPPSDTGFKTDPPFNPPGYRKPLSKEGGWERPTLVRTNVIPMAVGGRYVKQTWLAAIGALGVAANLVEMVFRWGIVWFWLIIPSGLALYIGVSLIRKRFFRFADLFNFESDSAGRVYLTTLSGDCPVCQSEVKLKDIGPKKHTEVVMQCTGDKTHQWVFRPENLEKL